MSEAPARHGGDGGETVCIAVVIDGTTVPAWVLAVLAGLERDASLDWRLTLRAGGPPRARRGGSSGLGLRAFEGIDARRRAPHIDDALAPRDATPMLRGHEVVDFRDDSDLASPMLRDAVRRATAGSLDLVLDLRAAPEPTALASVARCGAWVPGPVSDRRVDGEAVFWAIHDRQSACEVRVVVHRSDPDEPQVVATAIVGIQPASLTVSKSLCYWKAAKLVLQQLEHLHDGGCPEVAAANGDRGEARATSPRRPVMPVARVAARQFIAAVQHRRSARGTREQWLLGFRRRSDPLTLDGVGFHPVLPPADRAFADPFLIEHGAKTFLFLEEYEFARGRGVISVTTIDEDGAPGTPEVVLERPYHLSYPFVFQDGADHFMIPETAANRRVELYRATDFPRSWTLDGVLLDDVRALDSTLVAADGRYWLFTSIEEPGRNRNDELHLFSSTTLAGPWTPHPRNPVVSDVRCARPAGRPFLIGDSLIRPAQDCSIRYGSAIVFRRIELLSEGDYAEETVAVLPATWVPGLVATHTFATLGDVDVVDGLRRVPRD